MVADGWWGAVCGSLQEVPVWVVVVVFCVCEVCKYVDMKVVGVALG